MEDKTLVNAILQLIQEQKKTNENIEQLIVRVNDLTTMVFNKQPIQYRPSVTVSRRDLGVTALVLVILALAVIAIVQSGCSENPRSFDADTVDTIDGIDSGDSDIATGDSDTDTDSDSDSNIDGDSDGDSDTDADTDIDTNTDLDTDTTPGPCPWDCKTPANPGWSTCDDDFDIVDGGVPDLVHNWNFECIDDDLWCCQPWPSDSDDDSLSMTENCPDIPNARCMLDCPDDSVIKHGACYHASYRCCETPGGINHELDGLNTDRSQRIDRYDL